MQSQWMLNARMTTLRFVRVMGVETQGTADPVPALELHRVENKSSAHLLYATLLRLQIEKQNKTN